MAKTLREFDKYGTYPNGKPRKRLILGTHQFLKVLQAENIELKCFLDSLQELMRENNFVTCFLQREWGFVNVRLMTPVKEK